jgi:acetyl esterase/lipase
MASKFLKKRMLIPRERWSANDSSNFLCSYKTVDSHDIKSAVLIPKGLAAGNHPVILNIHGGFFTMAHSLFAEFFPQWALELAREKGAIIVSADYRLLPTANGIVDQAQDISDWWAWTRTDLNEVLQKRFPGHSADLSRLVLTGASAGGYHAAQLALSHPDDISILAVGYPALGLKDHLFTTGPRAGESNILNFPGEAIPSKEKVIEWIDETRKTIATKAGFERIPFSVGACHGGIFYDQIIDNKNLNLPELFPLARMETGARLPKKVWMIHGENDVTVRIENTRRFAAIIADQLPDTQLRLDAVEGMDHGFDVEEKNWASFKKEALDFVVDAWLQ